jgi:hypothetical protein
MSGFRDELRVVPRPAWVVAAIVCLAFAAVMFPHLRDDPQVRAWPEWGKMLLIGGSGLLLFAFALLVGYVYGDARRRGMRYVMWTLLAALIPNAIGIILYFVLRDPLTQPCPNCRTQLQPGYAFCPRCGAPLARACPQCRAAIEPGWAHCVRCGTAIPAA